MEQLSTTNGYATRITVPGTTVISSRSCTVQRLLLSGTIEGTIALYNSPTVAGTAAGNLVLTFGNPTVTTYPLVLPVGIVFKDGLVATATGTPSMVIVTT